MFLFLPGTRQALSRSPPLDRWFVGVWRGGGGVHKRLPFGFQITSSLSWLAPERSPGRALPSGRWTPRPMRRGRTPRLVATTTAPSRPAATSTPCPWPTPSPSTPRPSWSGTWPGLTPSPRGAATACRGPGRRTSTPSLPAPSPRPPATSCRRAPRPQTRATTSPRAAAAAAQPRGAPIPPIKSRRSTPRPTLPTWPPETASDPSTRRPWPLCCEHTVNESCCGTERRAVRARDRVSVSARVYGLTGSCGGVVEAPPPPTVYRIVQLVLSWPLGRASVGFCGARKMKVFRWHFSFL